MQTLKKIFFLFNLQERKNFYYLTIMNLIMAILDMMGVASILPFVTLLTNPNLIETNSMLNSMFEFSKNLGIENNQQFLFFSGIIVLLILVISLTFKAFTTYLQLTFNGMCDYSISKKLMENYLHQPYSWFLGRNSADLGRMILSQVSDVVGNGISPLMEIIAKGAVAISIICLLFIVDAKLAIIVGFSLGLSYGIIYKFIRNYLNKLGKERLENNEMRYNISSEAFSASKVVKISGLEQTFINRFSEVAKKFIFSAAFFQAVSQLPRFALEIIAFAGTLSLILFLMAKQATSFDNIIPIISLYVFAAYRLMPAIQQIYLSFSKLAFVGPSLDKVFEDLKNTKLPKLIKNPHSLTFDKTISLKNINYNYPNSSITALKKINLSIPYKTTVGFIGPTGSGKTTMIDIILGLLESRKGTLEVDGKIISKINVRSWQSLIGYVPQHIYLSDDTVAGNIAFGQNPRDINLSMVERASKTANLHDFVINQLPKKYETSVGERGVRLSGGQIQRIGIARALYHNPKVLIFDEATSALDNQTEKIVMEAVNKLGNDKTIIIVAHRLNTVKNCDIIFKLENGNLVGQGKFDELISAKEKY